MSVLSFQEVTRRYGDVVAMNRVSIDLDGGITALVGPNGAGKSTFMKLATGHVRPTAGTVTAFGQPVWDNPWVMAQVGFVPEQDAFYEWMTGLDFVTTLGTLQGLAPQQAARLAEAELEALGLGHEAWERPIRTYSKGMRQRVKLAQALLHSPRLLFLDEPLLGCDPVARRRLQDRIRGLRDEGCTVLFATHILPEVERLTRDIAVVAGGRLVAQGDAGEIRDILSQIPSRVRLECKDPRLAAATLASWSDVAGVHVRDQAVEVETPRLRALLERVQRECPAAWGLVGMETVDADLDSLFTYLAGEQA